MIELLHHSQEIFSNLSYVLEFLAQVADPSGGSDNPRFQFGVAGSLIGAVLESLGYHLQALILTLLRSPFTNQIGGLIYLVAIVIAVTAVATRGNYRDGVWLLIGPPLFFAVILSRTEIGNAQWKFGFRERNQAEVSREVANVMNAAQQAAGGGNARVSTLFARYVHLVSVVSQHLITIISNQRLDEDLWFIARAELFAQMHTIRIDDVNLRRLIHLSLFGYCREVLDNARAAHDPIFRARRANRGRAEMDQTPSLGNTRSYFENMARDAERDYRESANRRVVNLDRESAFYVASQIESVPFVNELAIGVRATVLMYQPQSCLDIWAWTLRGLEHHARRGLGDLVRRGEAMGIEGSALLNVMGQAHGISSNQPLIYMQGGIRSSADARNIQRIIGHYIFRNESRELDRSAWLAYFTNRVQTRSIEGHFQGRNSFTEQTRLGAMEWSERERLMHAAASLPYDQGLALYVLGGLFPFFALLLLVPGKHAGFLLWFVLWLWVKSWDVALAILMLVDSILFSMLSVQNQTIGQQAGVFDDHEMDIAYASLAELDPTFQLTTYYTIIAAGVLAIVPTTAQVLLASLRGGSSLIASGVERISEHFATDVRFGTQQIASDWLLQQAQRNKEARVRRYLSNIRAGRSPYAAQQTRPDGEGSPHPLALNPVLSQRRIAGGAHVGPDTPPGSGISYDEARENLNRLAAHSGFAAGLTEQQGPIGNPQARGFAHTALRMFNARSRYVDTAHWQGALAMIGQDLRAVTADALWDADIDRRAVYLNEMITMYEGLPIPHSRPSNESSGAHFNALLARFTFRRNMLRAEWAAARDVIQNFRRLATGIYEQASGARNSRLLTLGQVEQLGRNRNTRAIHTMIRTRYQQYLQRTQALTTWLQNPALRVVGTGGALFGPSGNRQAFRSYWNMLAERVMGEEQLYTPAGQIPHVGQVGRGETNRTLNPNNLGSPAEE